MIGRLTQSRAHGAFSKLRVFAADELVRHGGADPMPADQFKLPNGRTVQRIFGVRHPAPESNYLNWVRMGLVTENSPIAVAYHNQKQIFAQRLVSEIEKAGVQFDTLVSPASSRDNIDVYRAAVLKRLPTRVLSGFTRKGKVKAGDS